MSTKRKDDHIKFAKDQGVTHNALDDIGFIHHSLPFLSLDDINLETTILGIKFPLPFYINAMTGGNKQGNAINEKLAALANHFNMPFFLGSQSLALKDERVSDTYRDLRAKFPNLFIVSNINPNFTLTMANHALNVVNANALAIHLNSIQELTMAEGDRDFTKWHDNIKTIINNVKVPVIVKEVGYGMHDVTLKVLNDLHVKYIDVSGTGGTNFTRIEMARINETANVLTNFGRSTKDSLLNALKYSSFTVYASGGINDASHIVKVLALGAKAVGMAHFFLKLSELPLDEMINAVNSLIIDLKKIMVLLNAKTINDLNIRHLIM